MKKPILYGIDLSPPVRGVWLTAKAMNLELEKRPVNLLAGEHLTPEYLKVHEIFIYKKIANLKQLYGNVLDEPSTYPTYTRRWTWPNYLG